MYFDEPVDAGTIYNIDRYGKGSVYLKDQLIPISWASLSGKTLMKMYEELKANRVYVMKEYLQGCQGNQYLKTRLKNA